MNPYKIMVESLFYFLGMIGKLLCKLQGEGIHASSAIAIITYESHVDMFKNWREMPRKTKRD